ncbi:hypothetical protein MRX96_029746 [Rhipicephalus microplus]
MTLSGQRACSLSPENHRGRLLWRHPEHRRTVVTEIACANKQPAGMRAQPADEKVRGSSTVPIVGAGNNGAVFLCGRRSLVRLNNGASKRKGETPPFPPPARRDPLRPYRVDTVFRGVAAFLQGRCAPPLPRL